MLLLVYFISRKGSPVAKWIYVVLGVLGLIGGLSTFSQTLELGTLPVILTIIQYALLIAALWLLFRPDSKAWFADGRGGPDTTH
jgi:fluoride ion exporter CrcB/FEX